MRNRLQHEIATGRVTLPVAIVISLVLWIITYQEKSEVIPFISGSIISYLLIELNTYFDIIRSRSSLPSSVFILLYSSILFLHSYGNGECLILLLFISSFFFLLRSYSSSNKSPDIFHAFIFLSIGCLIEPFLIFAVPIIFISMIQLRCLNIKTFFAGIIGLMTPLWIISGYKLINNQEINIGKWIDSAIYWDTSFYYNIPEIHIISTVIVLLISITSGVTSLTFSLKDKVKTRIIIRTINIMGMGATLLLVAKPAIVNSMLPIIITTGSILYGYILTQIKNKLTYIFMIISFILLAILIISNIIPYYLHISWMQLFSF